MDKNLNITNKELQAIGLRLVEVAPSAEIVDVYIYGNTVNIRASYKDGSSRWADVPLLKEVHD